MALMKMGLSVIIVGHVNFLLGALVHGVVLRHVHLHKQARAMEYAISNVVALTSGILGIAVGILFIVLSKNKKSTCLVWSLFILSPASALMAAASAIGLFVSVVRAITHGGRSLLTHCRFPDAIGYSSVTNECPFDPTRIYSTTLVLWVPLIVTCVIQLVFSARCVTACVSFLELPCCPTQRRAGHYDRAISAVRPAKEASPSHYTEPPRDDNKPAKLYTDPPRWTAVPARQERSSLPQPQQDTPHQHRSLSPTPRQLLQQIHRARPDVERPGARAGSQRSVPEQHRLLERSALERSSFWI
ncbi:transmembrane protein 54-like [Xenentodon cancila]